MRSLLPAPPQPDRSGKNSQLKQERSTNWSSISNTSHPHCQTPGDLTYFHIDSRTGSGFCSSRWTSSTTEYRSTVNRSQQGTTPAICNHGISMDSPMLPVEPHRRDRDLRTRKRHSHHQRLDLNAVYTWHSAGRGGGRSSGTYVFDYSAAATADSPKIQCGIPPTIQSIFGSEPVLQ